MAKEKRMIDANEVIEKINCLCVDGNENWIGTDNQSFVDHAEVIDILSDMPTVDAVEVIHGRWEPVYHYDDGEIDHIAERCSVCKGHVGWFKGRPFNYCPNCGAKMDGGNEDV